MADAGDRLLAEILAMEERVWAALETGDTEADARLLGEEFLGVYPTGFSGRSAHAGQLRDGPTVTQHAIRDARIMVLAPDTVLLAYRADYTRPGSAPESMYVSSVWRRGPDGWINIFSQDTPQGGPVP